MNILIVCSGNSGGIVPFISDQMQDLLSLGLEIEVFKIKGKGIKGYLSNLNSLNNKIYEYQPQIVHAHYGLSGLLANLQNKVPVVTSYHGSDTHYFLNRFFSFFTAQLSSKNIFVNNKQPKKIFQNKNKSHIIPCGVNLDVFHPIPKHVAKKSLNLALNKKYILFSSNFTNQVKNYNLAKESMKKIDAELIELKGYTRKEVTLLLNASESLILTSYKEGSPQIVKEAMACNTPVVSTNVGDVKWLLNDLVGHYISRYNPKDFAEKIKSAIQFSKINNKTKGRERIKEIGLDSMIVAKRILKIYRSILK